MTNSSPQTDSVELNPGNTNTNTDGTTGPYNSLIVGDNSVPGPGPYGTIVSNIHIHALGDTQEGMVRLFFKENGGAAWRLIREIPIPLNASDNQTPCFSQTINISDVFLAPQDALAVTSTTTDFFAVSAFGYKLISFSECCC